MCALSHCLLLVRRRCRFRHCATPIRSASRSLTSATRYQTRRSCLERSQAARTTYCSYITRCVALCVARVSSACIGIAGERRWRQCRAHTCCVLHTCTQMYAHTHTLAHMRKQARSSFHVRTCLHGVLVRSLRGASCPQRLCPPSKRRCDCTHPAETQRTHAPPSRQRDCTFPWMLDMTRPRSHPTLAQVLSEGLGDGDHRASPMGRSHATAPTSRRPHQDTCAAPHRPPTRTRTTQHSVQNIHSTRIQHSQHQGHVMARSCSRRTGEADSVLITALDTDHSGTISIGEFCEVCPPSLTAATHPSVPLLAS
jgi:hypothetical protein